MLTKMYLHSLEKVLHINKFKHPAVAVLLSSPTPFMRVTYRARAHPPHEVKGPTTWCVITTVQLQTSIVCLFIYMKSHVTLSKTIFIVQQHKTNQHFINGEM